MGLRPEAARRRQREIDLLVELAAERGECTDRLHWTLHYDFELAPLTTNLRQLGEVGVHVPAPDGLSDRELAQHLWEVIETLADLGVFLIHTDHLDDRALYALLHDRVLREPVRDLPPSEGVAEFIDLSVRADPGAPGVVERDRFLPKPGQFSGEMGDGA